MEDVILARAEKHRAAPMIGRAVGRHALPITFGLKVPGWITENRRNIARLKSWLERSHNTVAILSYRATS